MRARVLSLTLAGLLAVGVSAAGAAVERQVSIKNNAYSPHRVIAVTDDSVTWTNNEVIAGRFHTVTSDTAIFASPTLGLGGTFTRAFDAPGLYSYHCAFHANMHGMVVVYDVYFAGPASTLLYGKTAAMSGYAPEGSSVDINLEGGSANPVATVVADGATGRFTASIPALPGRYQAVVASPSRTSSFVRVKVKPKLAVKNRRKGRAYWITVSTNPNQTGGKMLLQRKRGSSWRKLAARTLGANSKAVFKVVPKTRMKVRLRLSHPVGGYAQATSGTLTLRR